MRAGEGSTFNALNCLGLVADAAIDFGRVWQIVHDRMTEANVASYLQGGI